LKPHQTENGVQAKFSINLIRAIKPMQVGFALPKFALSFLFGKTNRPSRTYDELVMKYKTKLAAGGKAGRPFIPPLVGFEKKLG